MWPAVITTTNIFLFFFQTFNEPDTPCLWYQFQKLPENLVLASDTTASISTLQCLLVKVPYFHNKSWFIALLMQLAANVKILKIPHNWFTSFSTKLSKEPLIWPWETSTLPTVSLRHPTKEDLVQIVFSVLKGCNTGRWTFHIL